MLKTHPGCWCSAATGTTRVQVLTGDGFLVLTETTMNWGQSRLVWWA